MATLVNGPVGILTWWIVAGLAAGVTGPPAVAGPAIGQFEVKTLDAEPGEIDLPDFLYERA